MSERVFWKCTPRKLMALFEVHKQVQGIETQEEEKEVYADQIAFL
ncbi:hypothetical protein [Clostridium sp. USBA 49]|nr:hypothetical protein [Clostridium sp. USBA 49]